MIKPKKAYLNDEKVRFYTIAVLFGKLPTPRVSDRVPTVMEKSWKMTGHGKVIEKSWNSVGHGKSHEKPKFGQIYFVDFVELRALKEFLNFAINIFNHISTF